MDLRDRMPTDVLPSVRKERERLVEALSRMLLRFPELALGDIVARLCRATGARPGAIQHVKDRDLVEVLQHTGWIKDG